MEPALSLQIATAVHHRIHTVTVRMDSVGWVVSGTKHLVNADVLNALGARGVVVNIARGSVIDTAALAAALREGRIAAAGLDVYESEPAPPAELLDLDNVVLTPHVAGWSPEAVQASVDRFLENARRHLAGEAPVSPL